MEDRRKPFKCRHPLGDDIDALEERGIRHVSHRRDLLAAAYATTLLAF
jgi:hypothetical protein